MKAAVVNQSTNMVENIIIVDSLADDMPPGYILAEIDTVEIPVTSEMQKMYDHMKKKDPNFLMPDTVAERVVMIGETKWTAELGFHD